MRRSAFRNALRSTALGALLLGLVATVAHAQAAPAIPASPRDSIFRRARKLVGEGNGVAGRALVDSVLRQSTEGSAAFGDALYWHGALAETAADAERDYRRVIVEYPVSLYVDDALLALVELEQARGDRVGALQHLQRFVREHQVANPARGVAALAAARLAFDQRDTRTGCTMITEARASAAARDVEMRNQIDYFSNRCTSDIATVAAAALPVSPHDTTPASAKPRTPKATVPPLKVADKTPKAPTVAPEQKPERKTEVTEQPRERVAEKPADTPKPALSARARGSFTIQLAAYNTQADAERLVAKLKTQGVAARVSGVAKPFRVRLDFYPTRQAAQDAVAALKQRGIIGFVATEEPPAETKTP